MTQPGLSVHFWLKLKQQNKSTLQHTSSTTLFFPEPFSILFISCYLLWIADVSMQHALHLLEQLLTLSSNSLCLMHLQHVKFHSCSEVLRDMNEMRFLPKSIRYMDKTFSALPQTIILNFCIKSVSHPLQQTNCPSTSTGNNPWDECSYTVASLTLSWRI